jgi:hypothetical protein
VALACRQCWADQFTFGRVKSLQHVFSINVFLPRADFLNIRRREALREPCERTLKRLAPSPTPLTHLPSSSHCVSDGLQYLPINEPGTQDEHNRCTKSEFAECEVEHKAHSRFT